LAVLDKLLHYCCTWIFFLIAEIQGEKAEEIDLFFSLFLYRLII